MTQPSGRGHGSERHQVRLLRALLLAGAALEVFNAAYIASRPELAHRILPSRVGAVMGLVLAALALWPRVGVRPLQGGVVAVLCVWFASNAVGIMVTQRPVASGLLLQLVIVALVTYSWLPVRLATGLVGALYGLLLIASGRSERPDVPGAALTTFILPLIWYLCVHGRSVRHERGRSVELQALAFTDPLTGVLNRRAGTDRLTHLAARSGGGAPLLVVLLDLDHFKRVNDRLGHAGGDRMLIEVTGLLQGALHADDLLVRWGGEEFLVALPGPIAASRQRVEGALHAVRQARLSTGTASEALTVSAGLASLDEAGHLEAALELADRRLYRAKAAGRDRLVAGGG
ncbi:diguanylate cyclase [uncultured Deinococcus sp.]|uniref:GGDEF domain-containing protein n=1 Tax=uncultured Deinococcus sp. TaxID=158789 RepID=UPI0025CF648C|nr:diguanylate cyclase [uncultured Deinococcus sp.]